MGKALEEIERVVSSVGGSKEVGRYEREILDLLRGLKAVVIALEDIAKAIRER